MPMPQVRGYAQAGFAGVLIEDQVSPKQCGHMRTRAVRGAEEGRSRPPLEGASSAS